MGGVSGHTDTRQTRSPTLCPPGGHAPVMETARLQFAPIMGGRVPPKPPLSAHRGPGTPYNGGETPPNPPSSLWDAERAFFLPPRLASLALDNYNIISFSDLIPVRHSEGEPFLCQSFFSRPARSGTMLEILVHIVVRLLLLWFIDHIFCPLRVSVLGYHSHMKSANISDFWTLSPCHKHSHPNMNTV